MTTFAAMKARLNSFARQEATGSADLDYALRNHIVAANADITNAGVEINLVNKTTKACKLIAGNFCPETGVAANAASLDARLFFDDGAGAGTTALCDLWDGTASSSTSSQVSDFATVLIAQAIPVGSRIYVAVTVNAGGDVWDDTNFEIELAYD